MVPPSKDLFNQFELKFLRANALTYNEYEQEQAKQMKADMLEEEADLKRKGEYQVDMEDEQIILNSFD